MTIAADDKMNYVINQNDLNERYRKAYENFEKAINYLNSIVNQDSSDSLLTNKYEDAQQLLIDMPNLDQAKEIYENDTVENFQQIYYSYKVLEMAAVLLQTRNPSPKLLEDYFAAAKNIPHSKSYTAKQSIWTFGMATAALATIAIIAALIISAPVTGTTIGIAVAGLVIVGFSKMISTKPVDDAKASANRLGKTVDNSGGFFSFFGRSLNKKSKGQERDKDAANTPTDDSDDMGDELALLFGND